MKLLALLAALACLLAGAYVTATQVAVGLRAPSPLEASLAADGLHVQRAVASPLPVLARPVEAPQVVILAGAGNVPPAERAALASFANDGGEVWIVGRSAQPAAFGSAAEWGLQVLAGQVVAANSSTPTLATASGAKVQAEGGLALGSVGSAWTPYLSAPLATFRDSNGDGQLNAGEPSGPFVVGVGAAQGKGRVVFLAADSPEGVLSPALVADLLGGREGATTVLVVDHGALAPWEVPAATLLEEAATLGQPWLGLGLLLLGLVAALGVLLARLGPAAHEDESSRLVRRLAESSSSHPNEPGDASP